MFNLCKYGVSRFVNSNGTSCYMISILHILQQIPLFIDYINSFSQRTCLLT